DSTENLNGAIVSGLKALRTGMGDRDLLARGTLVVVYHDADRAARVTRDELEQTVRKPEYVGVRRVVVGVCESSKLARLDGIGPDESDYAATTGDLKATIEGVAGRIADLGRSYYYVVVCSGARAGEHELRIDVARKVKTDKGGEMPQTGTLRHRFHADGFGP